MAVYVQPAAIEKIIPLYAIFFQSHFTIIPLICFSDAIHIIICILKWFAQGRVSQKLSSRGKYVSVNIGPIRVVSSEQVI